MPVSPEHPNGARCNSTTRTDRAQTVKWTAVAALFGLTFGLGWYGLALRFPEYSITDHLYRAICLFVLNEGSVEPPVPWPLEIARFAAPALTGLTAALAAMTIFRERLTAYRARRMRGHAVICGLGERGALIAARLMSTGHRVVCVEQSDEGPGVERMRSCGVPVLFGDATDPTMLRRAGIDRAQFLFALSGSDYSNAAIVTTARSMSESRRADEPLVCIADIDDYDLCALLRTSSGADVAHGKFRLILQNTQESGALLALDSVPPRERSGVAPHVVIVGLGQMGRALLSAMVARQGGREDGLRPRFTIIDRRATGKIARLCIRHPELAEDASIVPLDLDRESPEFDRCAYLYGPDGTLDVDGVYLTFADDALAAEMALTLLPHVEKTDVPLFIRVSSTGGLASLLPQRTNVHVFDLLDRACTVERLLGDARSSVCDATEETERDDA